MHAQGVCHRDIKLENIFVGEDLALRLGDFSYAAKTHCPQSGQEKVFEDQVGTPFYVAPEIQRGKPYRGCPVDVFSLGVALFMMVMGQNPFRTIEFYKALWKRPNTDLFWAQFTKSARGEVGAEFKNLIERMLDYNPAKRITVSQIRQHPWCQMQILDEGFVKSCFSVSQSH